MGSKFDVVIVGAGLNGLTCGIELARQDRDVLILERNSRPGGACRTGEVTEPGFKHDLFATNINQFLGSRIYEEMGERIHEKGFDLAVSEQPYASVFPDGEGLPVYTDPGRTRSSIHRYSKSDAEAWSRLVNYFQDVSPHLFPLLRMPIPSLEAVTHLGSTLRELGWNDTNELASLLLKSSREFVEQWFDHEKVQALFIPWAFHLDYGPDVSGGALFPFLEAISDHLRGMAFAKGGVQNLVRALVGVFDEEGGTLKLEEPVEEIIVRNGRARGVRTREGKEYSAERAVVGNLTPTILFERLIDSRHLTKSFRKTVENYRYGPGTVMMHFALEEPLDWDAGEELRNSAYVHLAPYVDDVARTYQQVQAGLIPVSPLLVVGQPTAVDPGRAPAGDHVLWVQVRAVPSTIQGDAAGKIESKTWENAIRPFEKRVIDKLTKYAPNLPESILDYTTLGPHELEEENPNLHGGDSLGGSHHLDQHWAFRPFPGVSSYSTPVDRLYMCGASTWPGAGMNAASGYLCARELTSSRWSKLREAFLG